VYTFSWATVVSFSINLCVLFFQTATKLLGQIFIKLFGLNYLTNGSVRYFLWPRDTKCAVNRESLEIARLNYGDLVAATNLTGG